MNSWRNDAIHSEKIFLNGEMPTNDILNLGFFTA
jgi:hypothetical protein